LQAIPLKVFADKIPRAAQDALLQKSLLFKRQDFPLKAPDDVSWLLNRLPQPSLIHFDERGKILRGLVQENLNPLE
jgi:hypothetical protein